MHIQWSGELLFFIFVFGLISLAGFMLYDLSKEKRKHKKS